MVSYSRICAPEHAMFQLQANIGVEPVFKAQIWKQALVCAERKAMKNSLNFVSDIFALVLVFPSGKGTAAEYRNQKKEKNVFETLSHQVWIKVQYLALAFC